MRKRKYRRFFLHWAVLFFGGMAVPCYGQEPVFKASVSINKVSQNTVFDVQFELENATGSNFQPPSFDGFKVVGGPSIGSSTMIVNGAVSRSQSWSYSLLATRQGKFTIGPATVVAGPKKLKTQSISVEVVAPKDMVQQGGSTSGQEPVILRAEVDADHYYPGQQIVLTYRILFRENVQTVNTITEDDYADFFVQHFSDFSREATYETVNGVQFTSRIVKSMALFAHQSGSYSIDPMLMSVGINAPFPGNQGFFTMHRIQDIQVASEPLTLTILPLPLGAPVSFSGAVGQYQVKTIPGKNKITTDDAFTFQLEITGNGDSRRWDPPSPVFTGEFELYDPRIMDDKLLSNQHAVSHFRSVEYQMIPLAPGDFTVFVPLTFFDPDKKEYVIVRSDTMRLQVVPGQKSTGDHNVLDKTITGPPELMKYGSSLLKDKFWVSIPHLLLFGLIVSGSGLAMLLTYKRKSEDSISPSGKLKLSAGREAVSRLDLLEKTNQNFSAKDFFETATEIYYKYLENRLGIPPSELDESKLSTYLSAEGIPEPKAQQALQFFNQCLVVRYGGTPEGYTREEMLHSCREIIGSLEG